MGDRTVWAFVRVDLQSRRTMQRLSSFLGRKRVRALVAAATALGLASTLVSSDPAQADPKQFTAAIGVGSDTTQDVMNAMAGFSNNVSYLPVQSSALSGRRQLTSWDANVVGQDCITPKAPGATIDRPNGSSAGRRALSRAIDGTLFGTAVGCTNKAVTGLVQFARSSAPPATGTTCDPNEVGAQCITYIPFGRDALTFGYYARGTAVGNETTTLTQGQLAQIFSTPGPHNFGGADIYGCSIQTSSGTHQFWRDALPVTETQMNDSTQVCTPTTSDLQESDGNALKARADSTPALANAQVVIGYSAANFIAQTNGVGPAQLPTPLGTVKLGTISGLGVPVNGPLWGGPLTPNQSFYDNATFGRNVYNVLPATVVLGPGNTDIKTLFVGGTSGVCLSSVIDDFGFATPVGGCGTTTLHGPLFVGAGG